MRPPASDAPPGDDRLTHRYHESNFGRSARDAVYLVLAAFALLVAVVTAVEAVKWRKELTRDAATGRTARAKAAERTVDAAVPT